jgi:hypothetical protein
MALPLNKEYWFRKKQQQSDHQVVLSNLAKDSSQTASDSQWMT